MCVTLPLHVWSQLIIDKYLVHKMCNIWMAREKLSQQHLCCWWQRLDPRLAGKAHCVFTEDSWCQYFITWYWDIYNSMLNAFKFWRTLNYRSLNKIVCISISKRSIQKKIKKEENTLTKWRSWMIGNSWVGMYSLASIYFWKNKKQIIGNFFFRIFSYTSLKSSEIKHIKTWLSHIRFLMYI